MRNDQRKYPRRELDLVARITWPRPMPCVIADISASGARLTLEQVNLLPDEFILALNVDLMKKCKVMWRRRNQVGVRFLVQTARRGAGQPFAI